MGETIDDVLNRDNIKDLIDKTIADVENIESLVIAYTRNDGSLHWRSNCRRSEGLGIVEVIRHDYLFRNDEAD